MIISFAHTTPALLAGRKTVTRRRWKPSHADRMRARRVHDAYDRSPRVGGQRVATIEVVSVEEESTARLFWDRAYAEAEYWKEGGDLVWPTTADFRALWDPNEVLYRVEFKLITTT